VNQSFGVRHWRAIMRLKSLVIQVFARSIKNNHSPEEGDAILLAKHPFGYAEKDPRPARNSSNFPSKDAQASASASIASLMVLKHDPVRQCVCVA
jgi:hypothetical protein